MSEELIQKKYIKQGDLFGLYEFYNIGKTNISNLKKYKIIKNIDYGAYENKAPDALICDRRNKKSLRVIAVIEYKKPSSFDSEKKQFKAFEQCNDYCQTLNSSIGIITDGFSFFWINPKSNKHTWNHHYKNIDSNNQYGFSFIKNENGTQLRKRFEPTSTESIDIINLLLKTINQDNSIIIPRNVLSPSNLANQVWQSVWLATGDDPKKCLMTFTELFIFKFLSDLDILKIDENGNEINFNSVINKGKSFCLKYYLSTVRPYIKKLFPAQEDGTTIINGLSLKKDQNQDNLFHDILTSFNQYGRLESIDPNFKSRLFEDFLKGTTGKKQLAQFFTPRNVIKAIVEIADVKNLKDDSSICDSACGVGGFIIESILNRKSNEKNDFNAINSKIDFNIQYVGYDYDDLTIVLAKANLLITLTESLYENPTLTNEFSSLLGQVFQLTNKSIVGSLERLDENKYDLIMSNPPYVSKGMKLYRDYIKDDAKLTNFYKTPSVGKEGLFLQKVIQELKNNGEAFIILPDGFFYRPADNLLKKMIIDSCYVQCIISLPEKTFYATTKKTYILGLKKKENISHIQKYPVFSAIAFNIGESLDIDRIPIEYNDLITIVREYKYFHIDYNSYSSSEKNIKTISFEKFTNNFNWIIENYWSSDEKIDLGMLISSKNVTDDDLFDNIEFFKKSLDNIKITLENEFSKSNVNINTKYKVINLSNKKYFKFNTSTLGLTRKEYSKHDTKNENDIPLYTAARKPVAYVKKLKTQPITASNDNLHISIATDGDGTAGTNIFLHDREYYLNTSRFSFKILDKNILPEYIFYFIQDVKKKYGFNYKHKANQNNIEEIELLVPINSYGEFDIEKQNIFIAHYLKLNKLKDNMFDNLFEKIKDFENDINNQLSSKIKEYFSIE